MHGSHWVTWTVVWISKSLGVAILAMMGNGVMLLWHVTGTVKPAYVTTFYDSGTRLYSSSILVCTCSAWCHWSTMGEIWLCLLSQATALHSIQAHANSHHHTSQHTTSSYILLSQRHILQGCGWQVGCRWLPGWQAIVHVQL
jgi:uncharacterized membrane protein